MDMQGNSEIFDTILIGAGPVNIIEAAYLIKQGKKVLIIEERDKPAGAWSTIQYNNLPEIEIGCHIWDVHEESCELLKELLDLNLVRLSPQPRIRKYGLRWPYDWKMNAITAKRFIKLTFKLQFGQIRKDIHLPANRFALLPKKYMYPKHGAFEVKKGIEKLIKDYSIPIKYGTCANSLQLDEKLSIQTENATYNANDLVISSLSHFREIKIAGIELKASYRRLEYIHVHLLLDKRLSKQISYDRIMGHPIIHRISDMSSQVADKIENNQSLVCVGVFQHAFHQIEKEQLAPTLLKELKALAYAKRDSKVIASGHNIFEAAYSDYGQMAELIKGSQNRVRLLQSTNFIFGIHEQLERWRDLINK